jgi:radical SAM-linked protein
MTITGREGILSRRDHPNPSAPPVQKLRLRYAKRGRLRFTSHRDVARAFERALRRAGVPMAYSQGFSPHPKVSWAGAVPTGVSSVAEYVEIQLVEKLDPAVLRDELNAALPDGIDVLDAVEAAPGPLADRLQVSRWRIDLPGTDVAELRDAATALMAADTALVERMTKDGRRTIDARAALVSAEVQDGSRPVAQREQNSVSTAQVDDWPETSEPYGILVTVVRQTTPVVRPDDVLSALRVVAGLAPSAAASATRLEQGRLDDGGGIADPLAWASGGDRIPAGEPAAG